MKSLKLIGLALGASFALSAGALAQDINIGVAGPMTGRIECRIRCGGTLVPPHLFS